MDRGAIRAQGKAIVGPWIAGTLVAALLLALALVSLRPPRPALLWNLSPSSPMGLYRVRQLGTLKHDEMLIAFAPEPARRLAASRHYLPHDVPLVKPVAAIANDRVCARKANIFVNGRLIAHRERTDSAGRLLPWWSGCVTLRSGEAFLLSANAPHAFDGRYFGVTSSTEIIGEADILWRV